MYKTIGKRIKTYKNEPFYWFLDIFYTVLYIFINFNTFSDIFLQFRNSPMSKFVKRLIYVIIKTYETI